MLHLPIVAFKMVDDRPGDLVLFIRGQRPPDAADQLDAALRRPPKETSLEVIRFRKRLVAKYSSMSPPSRGFDCGTIGGGPVAWLVGIEGGVVSGVTNLESPGVEAPGSRCERYHFAKARGSAPCHRPSRHVPTSRRARSSAKVKLDAPRTATNICAFLISPVSRSIATDAVSPA
jgi:hypothetical protein